MSTIEIENLCMKFEEPFVLKDVSLHVAQGEFLTLLGPSGCGKSTLLNLISGFLAPTSGVIRIGGKDVRRIPPERRDTAMCFQSYALFPHLTVRENLIFGVKQKRLPKGEQSARVRPVIEQLGLEPQLDKLPHQLSGGQQQRVALGRALVMRPGVILFDEPLSNLDAKLRETVRLEIRKIQRNNNLTCIYVTHDQAEALAMSDQVLVMKAGTVVQKGSPKEIYHHPQTSFVADFMGRANIMEAEVLSQTGPDHWNLATPLGEVLVQSSREPAAKHIRICWRPEIAWSGNHSVNSYTTKITHRSFQGSFTDFFFECGGKEYRLQMAETEDIAISGSIQFFLRPHDIVLLEPVQ
jgi:ABC-type Fe3+/spermidine/putrescine transport system ATPase subunit